MTANKMSPSELAKCRENLRHHWETRKVYKELVQRAWKDAQRVAAVLYQKYGASKVAVFGSLIDQVLFDEHSDIDMVVWGLPDDKFDDAELALHNLCLKFRIELKNIGFIKGSLLERIQQKAQQLSKGGMDVHTIESCTVDTEFNEREKHFILYKKNIVQRLTDALQTIQQTTGKITKALQDLDDDTPNYREYIEKAISCYLMKLYQGIEKLFHRIARNVDMSLPSGAEFIDERAQELGLEWTYELISQMGKNRKERPAVISSDTSQKIIRLLKYCTNIDDPKDHESLYNEAERHARQVGNLYNVYQKNWKLSLIF